MAKDGMELVLNAGLAETKEFVDEFMDKMKFTMSYQNEFEATAQRGSAAASLAMGPFAGKNNAAVKFSLTFSENGGKTTVLLADSGSGLGKTLTLTGGTTKKVLQDVYDTLKEGISRKGL